MTDHHSTLTPTPPEAELLRVLRDLRFGQVTVQVHDGRVVQIERSERFRIDPRPATTARGS